MFVIKIIFTVLLVIMLFVTIIVFRTSDKNQSTGTRDLNRRRIIFKFDIKSNEFELFNKTHLLDNKDKLSSFDILNYVDHKDLDETNKMITFLSNVSKNTFLFKETIFTISLKDKFTKISVKYNCIFKIRVDNIIFGEMSRVGGWKSDHKIEVESEFDKNYKQFEDEILLLNSLDNYIITLEPIIENDISLVFDEKSVYNMYSLMYERMSAFFNNKKILFYFDRNRRITFLQTTKNYNLNEQLEKIISKPVTYKNMYINLSFKKVISKLETKADNPTFSELRKTVLKNMYLLIKSKEEKSNNLFFNSSDTLSFENFLMKVDGIQDVFEKAAKSLEYKPYIYSRNYRIVGYAPIMDLYGEGFINVKDYFSIARCVQLERSLFSILMEKIIFDFFSVKKDENAVLFLPVPLDMVDKFLTLQDVLKEKMEFSKKKIVVMIFSYRNHTHKYISDQTRLLKKLGYSIGFYDVELDNHFSTIEETKPTFRSLDASYSKKINVTLEALIKLKKIKDVSTQEASFIIIENINSFEELQTSIDNGVDIVSGEYIYIQQNEIAARKHVKTDIEKIHNRNKYV